MLKGIKQAMHKHQLSTIYQSLIFPEANASTRLKSPYP